MNFVVFGLILMGCNAWTNAFPTNKFQVECNDDDCTELENFLKSFKNTMKNESEIFGLPQLDPFEKEESQILITDIIDFSLDTLLESINVNGLSDYIVGAGDFELMPPRITLDVTINELTATANYKNLTGQISRFEFNGTEGDITLTAQNIHFTAEIAYTLGESWNYMEKIQVKTGLELEKFEFHATRLFDNEDYSHIMSYVISEMVPRIIRKEQESVTQKLNEIMEQYLNHFVTIWKFKEILDIIHVHPFGYNFLALMSFSQSFIAS